MHRNRLHCAFLLLLLVGAIPLNAQSPADRDLVKRARLLYYSPTSRPAYIACDSAADWDAAAKAANIPQTDGYRRGMELVKAMKVSFVTRTRGDAEKTIVTVVGDPRIGKQKRNAEEQIKGFFHQYWMLADGRMLPGAKTLYEVTENPDGYIITQREDDHVTTVQMDKSFLITKATSDGVQFPQLTEIKPKFERKDDGLLHLQTVAVDASLGESRIVFEYNFDYQQAGGFYVPQHLTVSTGGLHSTPLTFSNCKVFDKSNAPVDPTPDAPPQQ